LEGPALALWLSSPGWQVTKNVTTKADEDNAVPGRIATAPLDLAVGHCNTLSVLDVRATEWFVVASVGDDGDVLITLHLIAVGPVSVRETTARPQWVVGLHQLIEPLAMYRIDTVPLTKVACRSLADGKDNDRRPTVQIRMDEDFGIALVLCCYGRF
jgi:hypothetical protein